MLEMHLGEQYGIPKERAGAFYDLSHGFWDYPSFWLMQQSGDVVNPLPLVPVVRVWSEELAGKAFAERLDFGSEDDHWIGSRFDALDGSAVVAVQGAGREGTVRFEVTGAAVVTVVSPFGVEQSVPVTGGVLDVQVESLPTYLRLPAGVNAVPAEIDYGREVARGQWATATASHTPAQAWRVTNGHLDNWYFPQNASENAYGSGEVAAGEAWVRVDLPRPTRVDTVEVVCTPPWQQYGALLDFDVQVMQDGGWVTVGTHTEPTPVSFPWSSYKNSGACFAESYWSRNRIWVTRLDAPVTTTAVRVLARDFSHGGAPQAGMRDGFGRLATDGSPVTTGQSGPRQLTIQEIGVYLRRESDDTGKPVPGGPMLITS